MRCCGCRDEETTKYTFNLVHFDVIVCICLWRKGLLCAEYNLPGGFKYRKKVSIFKKYHGQIENANFSCFQLAIIEFTFNVRYPFISINIVICFVSIKQFTIHIQHNKWNVFKLEKKIKKHSINDIIQFQVLFSIHSHNILLLFVSLSFEFIAVGKWN